MSAPQDHSPPQGPPPEHVYSWPPVEQYKQPYEAPPSYENRQYPSTGTPSTYGYPPPKGQGPTPQHVPYPPSRSNNPSHVYSESQGHSPSQSQSTSSAPGEPPKKAGRFSLVGVLDKIAPGKSPLQLLNPPPECFRRALPEEAYTYTQYPFETMVVRALGKSLDKGFPTLLPPAAPGAPHPFAVRDVQEEDWTRFVADVKKAGGMSLTETVMVNVIPSSMGHIGMLAGAVVTKGLEKMVKAKKDEPVIELLWHWNHYFFNPRGIDILIFQDTVAGYGSSSNSGHGGLFGGGGRMSRLNERHMEDNRYLAPAPDAPRSRSPVGGKGGGARRWCLQIQYHGAGSVSM